MAQTNILILPTFFALKKKKTVEISLTLGVPNAAAAAHTQTHTHTFSLSRTTHIKQLLHEIGRHRQHRHAVRPPQEFLVLVAARGFVRFALHPQQAADAHDATHDPEVLREVAASEIAEEGELWACVFWGIDAGGLIGECDEGDWDWEGWMSAWSGCRRGEMKKLREECTQTNTMLQPALFPERQKTRGDSALWIYGTYPL